MVSMNTIKNFVLRNTGFALRHIVLFFISTLLLLIGPIGCVVPLTGQNGYQTLPIVYGILVEDRSAGISKFRIANAQEFQGVRVLRGDRRLDTTPNMRLNLGDEIWTGPDSSVAIRFPNGSQLYLRSNSHVQIGSAFAFVGELFVRVKGAFQVDTEFVTAGAEGTEWVMLVSSNGDTRSIVLEGRVRMVSSKQLWQPMTVGANSQILTVGARKMEMIPASPSDINDIKRWVSQIDRLVRVPESPMSEYNRPPLFQFYFNSLHRRRDRHPGEYRPDRSDRSSDLNPGGDSPVR
jgi:hypothetical protein